MIILLVFGAAFAAFALGRSSAAADAGVGPQRLALPVGGIGDARVAGSPFIPSPIAVLCECLGRNAYPPPFLVTCAITEAQMIGRYDLADDIARKFGTGSMPVIDASSTPAPTQKAPTVAPELAAIVSEAAQAPFVPASIDNASRGSLGSEPSREDRPAPLPPVRSPIPGVPDDVWHRFAGQLVREEPTFNGPKHVGRYRQRKDRIEALKIDPAAIAGSSDAQDHVFAIDVADQSRHVQASGLDKAIGSPVELEGQDAQPITLSGLLGLASVAGLEGAAGWLSTPSDRQRYPHTTKAFLSTNGIF